jgi:cobalamin biosynthesis protein CobD/CbiB
MKDKKNTFQFIWGILLVLAGIGLFFRIPQMMPAIRKIEYFTSIIFFIYFCFYLIGILLIVGGGRKIYNHLKQMSRENSHPEEDVE